ncbi:CAMK family protein kinase [Tritrichomonas foetus]|uniref:CAMK family protein kinase n=1 Tax=Tritrichomonas foetus TaxID=1144522 RepID=A0A1J4KCU3_9EUKA|nr:CAMK family protein kinase [Tritrichomonas foetus]|eukprot:OHT09247.1 CAMK family protein kinase [Tritrichomonas foetus]
MSLNQTIVAPSRIGNFIFKGTVGSGAFSVVKLSYHIELKEFFACKIVPRNRINTDDLEQRFESEIRINQQMHHQGVVQIVDLLRDDMNYYIFMEFCPNGELFKYIVDRSRLSEPEAAHFMFQFLDAINYVHSLGVAHRDLKPENLLLDPSGRLKISDFGLSKFVGASGIVSTPCGSPCYASPECLSGTSYDGRKSDIWSIGVIMFAMVTGQLPWTKRNQAQLFNQIRRGDYIIPDFLSLDCRELLSKLLTVDASERISIQDALDHSWIKRHVGSDISDLQNSFTLVSLKKVDQFFDNTVYHDASVEKENIEGPLSQRNISFNSATRAITLKNVFPSAPSRARGANLSQ